MFLQTLKTTVAGRVRRLACVGLVATAALTLVGRSHAEIVHVQPTTPIQIPSGFGAWIDLNQDGWDDVSVGLYETNLFIGEGAVVGEWIGIQPTVRAMAAGAPIDWVQPYVTLSSLPWNYWVNPTLSHGTGAWSVPGFVGLVGTFYLDFDGAAHFAWMRVRSPSAAGQPAEVLDWAYETLPETAIGAGNLPLPVCPPRIDAQPMPSVATSGDTVVLRVEAVGVNPTYQWTRNDQPMVDGGRITGATTRELSIADARVTDSGTYRVIVGSNCGQSMSEAAMVNVRRNCAPLEGGCLTVGGGCASAPDHADLDLQRTATIEGWFYADASAPSGRVVSKGDGWDATTDRSYDITYHPSLQAVQVEFFLGAQGTNNYVVYYSGPIVAPNAWHHFAATIDTLASRAKIYINGVLAYTQTVVGDGPATIPPIAIRNSSQPLRIGSSGWLAPYHGRIDEVRVWNVVRNASEIAANFDRTVDPQSAGLMAYYHFDESAAAVAHDATGRGHDAALVGAAQFAVVHTCCPADFDGDGIAAVADVFAFLTAWLAGEPRADFDGAGSVNVQDILAFLTAWFSGC